MKFILCLVLSLNIFAGIYGKDDRVEIFQAPKEVRKLAKSVAAMISKDKLVKTNVGEVSISAPLYKDLGFLDDFDEDVLAKIARGFSLDKDGTKMCRGVNFYAQRTAAECTAFLITEDLLLTAGHCTDEVSYKELCENYSFVFDYFADHNFHSHMMIDQSNIYECEKIQYSTYIDLMDPKNWGVSRDEIARDFAVIKLKRKVLDREALPVASNFKYEENTPVFTIGTPTGLPLKYSGLGWILPNSLGKNSVVTNLDTFSGNSGSPVFSLDPLAVIGILVNGAEDFEEVRKGHNLAQDKGELCLEPTIFDDYSEKIYDGSNGEVVFKIDRVFGAF